MELLLIAKNRLKIVLTSEDMEKYAISKDEMGDSPRLREFLRRILANENPQVDFDADAEQIRVQLFSSKDGGCEMYISDVGYGNLPVPLSAKGRKCRSVFLFSDLEYLLRSCRALAGQSVILGSDAYAEEGKEKYYLVLTTLERDAFGRNPCLFSAANEYGRYLSADLLSSYLREHAVCLCEKSAVETLGKLAEA